jgi:hypothetical protein
MLELQPGVEVAVTMRAVESRPLNRRVLESALTAIAD